MTYHTNTNEPPVSIQLEAFKTPILSVLFLHPYKIFACSDSLGHIFFYYYTRENHALIGIIRNSKRLESLGTDPATGSTVDDSHANLELGRRATILTPIDTSHVKGHHRRGAPNNSQSSFSSDLLAASKRAMMDYPPVLDMIFEPNEDVLYTADDMGYLKGWKLRDVLFEPHIREHRSRGWNDFSSRDPSLQRPSKNSIGIVDGFPHDSHELMKSDEIMRVFHSREIPPTTDGTPFATAHVQMSSITAQSMMFRVRPFLVIAAHNGACNGVQLVRADAGLQTRLEQFKADTGATQPPKVDVNTPISPSQSRINSPTNGTGPLSGTKDNSKTTATPNPALNSNRVSVAGDESTRSSAAPSKATTARSRIASAKSTAASSMKAMAQGDSAASGTNSSTQPPSQPELSRKQLDSLNEAKLRRWDEQAWDDDTDPDDDDETDVAPLPNPSSVSSTTTYRDARDLPDRPKGEGRRVSVALEMNAAQQRKLSAARARSRPLSSVKQTPASTNATASAESIASADSAPPADASALASTTPTGDCLLSFGSDGCVHLFSLASHQRVATLQQGFTVRNSRATPTDWRYVYPIARRRERDEMILLDMIHEVEQSEQRLLEEREARALREQAERERERARIKYELDLREPFDPFRNVSRHGSSRASSGSKRSSLARNSRRKSGRLLLPADNSSGKRSSTSKPLLLNVPGDSARDSEHDVLNESKESLNDTSFDDAPMSDRMEERVLARQFNALEASIHHALQVEKKRAARLSQKRETIVPPVNPNANAASAHAAKEAQAQKSMLTSKSMSALSKSLYSAPKSGSASVTNLHSLTGIGAQAPPSNAPPSKKFSQVDYSQVWTDYDGTVRTIEDPLAYRFSVDSYLTDVALRHHSPSSLKPNSPDHLHLPQSVSPSPSLPSSPSLQPTDASAHTPSRNRPPRTSISIRSPSDPSLQDDAMAQLQQRALSRQRQLQLADSQADARSKARSEEILQATLDREKAFKAQLDGENRKLSPRSAEVVRIRMLLSRKPTKILATQLESLGMRINSSPKPRKELNAFGELQEVKYSPSSGMSTVLKRASQDGKGFAEAIKAAQKGNTKEQ